MLVIAYNQSQINFKLAFDCDWPPTTKDWRAEDAYLRIEKEVERIGKERCLFKDVIKWEKSGLYIFKRL